MNPEPDCYVGTRLPNGAATIFARKSVNGKPGELCHIDMRLDLRNHSPTGFEWGYNGSGPAQTALAVCADALRDDERALAVYQRFKEQVVSRLTGNWILTRRSVLESVDRIEAEKSLTPEALEALEAIQNS